jgi:hypothetical protein
MYTEIQHRRRRKPLHSATNRPGMKSFHLEMEA